MRNRAPRREITSLPALDELASNRNVFTFRARPIIQSQAVKYGMHNAGLMTSACKNVYKVIPAVTPFPRPNDAQLCDTNCHGPPLKKADLPGPPSVCI